MSKVKVIQWPWSKVTRIECLLAFSNDFSSETTGPVLTKFHLQHLGNRGYKVCSNGPGDMTKMASTIIYGKNLKKPSPEPPGWLLWNLICSIRWLRYYQMCSDGDPRLTLTYFSSRSNLVPWAFEWRKGKTLYLSKTVLSCDMKVGCTWTSVSSKGQGHSMNKLANHQTSKLSITCHVFSKDIPSEATWQIGSQFVCTVHGLGFYVLVWWKSLFSFGCYGNINICNWGKLKTLVTNQFSK